MNMAPYARPSTSFVSGHETLAAIHDGHEPNGMGDHSHGAYGNWPATGTQWVQYDWPEAIGTARVDVYWWDDGRGVRLPAACRLLYWDGERFAPVRNPEGMGVAGGRYNTTTFDAVRTTRLRLEIDGRDKFSTGILEWKVYDDGTSPPFAPIVAAGPDRVAVIPAATFLQGRIRGGFDRVAWSRAAGPGQVRFSDPSTPTTEASFSEPGDYELRLTASNGPRSAEDDLRVRVEAAPAQPRLDPVSMRAWRVRSPLWSDRLKQVIVHWIPHCIAKLSEPGLKEGGIGNFVEAANKNAGRPFSPHTGAPWANAYTLNILESMCLALMVDADGDRELGAAQDAIRNKLDEWIPVILAAQEPDGYLQTRFTLGSADEARREKIPPRWTRVGDHEGYVAGYFIDAAIAHVRLTGGRDRRLYDAARRLADCWDAHIGPPPKQRWHDGHQALEMALVSLGRLVDETEGAGRGARYVRLARFLLDCRGGGSEYDQSHLPVVRQYEAVGHAVRAMYSYAAMADVAMETGDPAYHAAVRSIWDNVVHAKYYVTGALGSGETSEGFGGDFSLPNHGYGESCAGCGGLFFQHRMNLAYRDARCADLAEETLFNAVLGSLDLPAKNFTYTNPLDQSHARYPWHGCPCCVGNIPRALLMLPRWMYARSEAGLWVNLYAGSVVRVGPVAGAEVELEQRTDYPWGGAVEIVVRPASPRRFTLFLGAPNRQASALYRSSPPADGIAAIAVNGEPVAAKPREGYVAIDRTWATGDTVRLELPMCVQKVRADPRVEAARGRVALRRGPLIYNIESVDQNVESPLAASADLRAVWEPDLLGGVAAIRGRFADGSPLLAIPHYARNNRGGRSVVWIREAEAPAGAR